MLNVIYGDLIKLAKCGEFDYIIHGCNCFNTMGAGIARNIAMTFPAAAYVDSLTIKGDRNKLGTYTLASPQAEFPITVINAYTQYFTSRSTDVFEYDAFQNILDNLLQELPADSRIGFPLIGCGLAGGDQPRIVSMINSFAEKFVDGTVTIVIFQA
jgi:O-acetyl-ADP-ribose deacetylase (regulator of RNase III)